MAFPTRLQVKGLFWQRLDDPAGVVFTDTPNPSGAPSVFQAGFSEAYDLLFNNALNQQIPLVEEVVQGIIIPPSPIPFSVTPAAIGLPDFGDVEWVSERTAGSTDKFIDLWDEDRLTQRAPTDRLLEFVYAGGAFNFVGCTTVRELQIKYVISSAGAPLTDTTAVAFDNSLAFLTNYAVGCMGGNKGYSDIADRCRSFAVGPKFDTGMIGGELFRLMQPLVRSRQNVKVAPLPFTAQRRLGARRAVPYVAVQGNTTGGSSASIPNQFSSANGTIVGTIDGVNATFWLTLAVQPSYSIFVNGVLQTVNLNYTTLSNQFTFLNPYLPQPGDAITAEAFLLGQVQ